jgi:tetratricopeptide (TPR) repeat protein
MVLGLQANLDATMRIPYGAIVLVLCLFLIPVVTGADEDPEEMLDRVTDLIRLGHMDDADANLTQMQEIYPHHLRSWMVRGLVLAYTDRADEALTEAETILKTRPDDGRGLALMIGLRIASGEEADALAASEHLVAVFPDSADTWDIHGGVLSMQADDTTVDDAIAAFDRALALDPQHVDALINRGELAEPTDPDEAERYLKRAVDARPSSTDANEALTTFLIAQARDADALAAFDRWLRVTPQNPFALTGKAIVLADQGKYEDALWLIDSVLRSEPRDPDALYLKGQLLVDLDRPQEAVTVLNRLLELYPDDEDAQNLRTEAASAVQASATTTPVKNATNVRSTTTAVEESPVSPTVAMIALLLLGAAYLRRR